MNAKEVIRGYSKRVPPPGFEFNYWKLHWDRFLRQNFGKVWPKLGCLFSYWNIFTSYSNEIAWQGPEQSFVLRTGLWGHAIGPITLVPDPNSKNS
jgi:hypothetical protein